MVFINGTHGRRAKSCIIYCVLVAADFKQVIVGCFFCYIFQPRWVVDGMEILNKEHFRTIRKAIENNKLAIFIGSAVSYDSELPSWADLIGLMKGALENPRTNDYLKIAEHYYLQYGRNTYYSKINEFFPTGSQPNLLHELLIKLRPQHIVTTNWDDLLEKAIANTGDLYFRVASDYELASSPSSQLLIKMHGDLTHRNIIFKESDYLAYSDKFPLVENFIKSLFSTHVVLFVGYSISDYNLNQILSWIRNRTQDAPPSFTILTESKITLSESNYLREKGVYPLLREESESGDKLYPELSSKSAGVARTLEKIIHPEDIEFSDILNEMAADVSNWEVVYPVTIVHLFKDRLNITEVNKIYYDSSENVVVYNLSCSEEGYSRAQYRKVRKSILRILLVVPVIEFRLVVSHKRFYRIRDVSKFNFIDEYTTFNFGLVSGRIASASVSLSNNLDDGYQFAFDNYYMKRLAVARESFMYIANRYFSKSLFVKSLVSSFNKKQLCFGDIPWEIYDGFSAVSMEEQLSRNDNISEMIDRFPKSIVSRQRALFQGLDANNSFLLERYKQIANLSREIDNEINTIESGGMVFSNRVDSMYNQASCTVLFVIKNRISVVYSSDYKNIARIAFESVVKRRCLEKEVKVDEVLSYLAIISFKEKDLVKFLSDNLKDTKALEISAETFDYIFKVLENCLDAMVSSANGAQADYGPAVWSNALIVLSYVKHDESISDRIINHLVRAFDTHKWVNFSEAINRFLVFQFNRYSNSFSVDGLKLLLDKQVEKISSSMNIPHQERGRLFSNLLYLIKNCRESEVDLFGDNKNLLKFISNVSLMEFDERLRAISGFVFVIYSLAAGDLKNNIRGLLSSTFTEAKNREFSESSIIFGLDLYNIGVLEPENLDFIFYRLQEKVKEHVEKGSTTSSFPVIKEQLSRIDASKLQGFEEVIEEVSRLSDSIESSFKRISDL